MCLVEMILYESNQAHRSIGFQNAIITPEGWRTKGMIFLFRDVSGGCELLPFKYMMNHYHMWHGCVLFSNVFFWDLFYKWVALYLNSIININLDFLVFSAKPTFFNTNFHQLHWVWCKVRVQSWIGSTIERCPDEQVSQPIVFHI